MWKGALSFGLVHIPVRMYSASGERDLTFKLLHKKDLAEIRYARICKADGKEIP
jgi:DNA end-binding protein Ku